MEKSLYKHLKYYLETLEYLPHRPESEKSQVKTLRDKFFVQHDALYHRPGNKRVLTQDEYQIAFYMYQHHQLGGHFAFSKYL